LQGSIDKMIFFIALERQYRFINNKSINV
jgi:hypothetical protein